jgi:hypothetical protein
VCVAGGWRRSVCRVSARAAPSVRALRCVQREGCAHTRARSTHSPTHTRTRTRTRTRARTHTATHTHTHSDTHTHAHTHTAIHTQRHTRARAAAHHARGPVQPDLARRHGVPVLARRTPAHGRGRAATGCGVRRGSCVRARASRVSECWALQGWGRWRAAQRGASQTAAPQSSARRTQLRAAAHVMARPHTHTQRHTHTHTQPHTRT